MNKTVPYNKQTIDSPNLIARFTHRMRIKNSLQLTLKYAPSSKLQAPSSKLQALRKYY
ncbi:hypothetical protein [Candidatus Nitrosacidococcus sp. I8]|uniref:hypothetical protein n=1 Tax=Candidatus Nitrosacidococcus sp. I8 TaxID=2942908 RepID=UPI0022276A2E|nr:hypothetical protein [Candidatus Nitrosacidococcus sp. I8]